MPQRRLRVTDRQHSEGVLHLAHLLGDPRCELVVGDVCDADLVDRLVADVDVVYHPVLGYPEQAIIDTEAVAVDGGFAFSITEFEELG